MKINNKRQTKEFETQRAQYWNKTTQTKKIIKTSEINNASNPN